MSRRVQYWLHCILDLNIEILDRIKKNIHKTNIRLPWWENANVLVKNKLTVNT